VENTDEAAFRSRFPALATVALEKPILPCIRQVFNFHSIPQVIFMFEFSTRKLFPALSIAALMTFSPASYSFEVIGEMPPKFRAISTVFPNSDAVDLVRLAPALADGFTPQGVTTDGSIVYISGYIPAEKDYCILFSINMETMQQMGKMTLPPACKHGGGVALIGKKLVVSDTRALFVLDFLSAGERHALKASSIQKIVLDKPVLGSYITTKKDSFFLGTYSPDCAHSKLYEFSNLKLDRPSLSVDDATRTIQTPSRLQGAAFESEEILWVASNKKNFGLLQRIALDGSAPPTSWRIMRGVEGIVFHKQNELWTVSESGTKHYQDWSHSMPALLKFNKSKLNASKEEDVACLG
jgi:hypothetical protein